MGVLTAMRVWGDEPQVSHPTCAYARADAALMYQLEYREKD